MKPAALSLYAPSPLPASPPLAADAPHARCRLQVARVQGWTRRCAGAAGLNAATACSRRIIISTVVLVIDPLAPSWRCNFQISSRFTGNRRAAIVLHRPTPTQVKSSSCTSTSAIDCRLPSSGAPGCGPRCSMLRRSARGSTLQECSIAGKPPPLSRSSPSPTSSTY